VKSRDGGGNYDRKKNIGHNLRMVCAGWCRLVDVAGIRLVSAAGHSLKVKHKVSTGIQSTCMNAPDPGAGAIFDRMWLLHPVLLSVIPVTSITHCEQSGGAITSEVVA